jgi:hypothetical protein
MSYSWTNAWLCSGTFQPCCARCSQWIGRGPTAWPPRSPDLNPRDVYLWGHLNPLVYAAPVDNEETLHRIVDACQTIRKCPGISERMLWSIMRRYRSLKVAVQGPDFWPTPYNTYMMRRVEVCTESHGGHFQRTLSAVTHKLNVSGRILIWTCFLVLVFGTRAQSLFATFSYIPCIPYTNCKERRYVGLPPVIWV